MIKEIEHDEKHRHIIKLCIEIYGGAEPRKRKADNAA